MCFRAEEHHTTQVSVPEDVNLSAVSVFLAIFSAAIIIAVILSL